MGQGGRVALGTAAYAAVIAVSNASALAPRAEVTPRLLAHRGVHQTLPSMQAAFDAGADAVELDVHATADGQLAVLHDATLDCRTDGHGAPEEHTLAVGLLVTLPEVLAALPGRAFVIHIKSRRPEDGDRVADVLAALPEAERRRQIVYGGAEAVARVDARLPEVRTFDTGRVKACLKGYLLTGWLGHVPAVCADTLVLVPSNYTGLIWGFPRRFEARMAAVGTEVALAGPLVDGNSTGIDDPAALAAVPDDFGGWIWTNRVEVLGPLVEGPP